MDESVDEENESKNGHHVAWKDRLGLNREWERLNRTCNESIGGPEYPTNVECFFNNLVNIRKGPQLRIIVDDYRKEEIEPWKTKEYLVWAKLHPREARDPPIRTKKRAEIEYDAYKYLHRFILQTLEDNGFCFYKSEFDGIYDEIK